MGNLEIERRRRSYRDFGFYTPHTRTQTPFFLNSKFSFLILSLVFVQPKSFLVLCFFPFFYLLPFTFYLFLVLFCFVFSFHFFRFTFITNHTYIHSTVFSSSSYRYLISFMRIQNVRFDSFFPSFTPPYLSPSQITLSFSLTIYSSNLFFPSYTILYVFLPLFLCVCVFVCLFVCDHFLFT